MRTSLVRALSRAVLLTAVLPAFARAQAGDPKRGAQLFDERNLPAARGEFSAVLGRDRNDANALYYMGRIALAEGRTGEAVEWLEKAVKADERSSLYHLWLGNALGEEAQRASKLRQPFLARRVKAEFERAVGLDPRSIDARMGLINFYVIAPGVMGGSLPKARAQAAEIAKISPLQGHLAAGSIAQREKDLTAAEREYKAAVAENPDSTVAHLALSAFYQNTQRWAEAFAVLDKLLAARPEEIRTYYQVGRAAALSGQQLDRGEQALKTWLAHTPADATLAMRSAAHYRLGMIYEREDKRDLARGEYEQATRINPRNEDARKALARLAR
jgi:tetratricopeptide (TPR) repeat protein